LGHTRLFLPLHRCVGDLVQQRFGQAGMPQRAGGVSME